MPCLGRIAGQRGRGDILASSVVVVGGAALPSLTAYRLLFILCAAAAVLGAGIAMIVPYPPGYSPSRTDLAAVPEWRSSQLLVNGPDDTTVRSAGVTPPVAARTSPPPIPRPSSSDEP